MPKSLINKQFATDTALAYVRAKKYEDMLIATFLGAFPSFTINDIDRTQGRHIGNEGRGKGRHRGVGRLTPSGVKSYLSPNSNQSHKPVVTDL